MIKKTTLTVAFFTVFLSSIGVAFAEPRTVCMPMEKELEFKCNVTIVGDAKVEAIVSMMMPSMAMAHNVPPVVLSDKPEKSGEYQFFVELPMLGEWMFTYDVTTPKWDRFRNRLLFIKGQIASSEQSQARNANDN
jgi:hypothetical protein